MEKIEKLELKHLCGYLPHGLKCQYFGIVDVLKYNGCFFNQPYEENPDNGMGLKIGELKEIKIYKKYWKAYVGTYHAHLKSFVNGYDFKPLLLPLSALTNPLEDGTIPIVELAKIELSTKKCQIGDLYNVESFKLLKDHFCEFYEKEDSYTRYWFQYNEVNGFSKQIVIDGDFESTFCNISINIFEYLYSKHFDIYGLIPAGLAIDKRTVKL